MSENENVMHALKAAMADVMALIWWVEGVAETEGGPLDAVPDRIQRGTDTKADTLVEFLEAMHEGPLPYGLSDRTREWTPAAWSERLRAWAKQLLGALAGGPEYDVMRAVKNDAKRVHGIPADIVKTDELQVTEALDEYLEAARPEP